MTNFTENQINTFLGKSSFSGLLSIFSLKLSLDKKIAFNRTSFDKNTDIPKDYFHGYIVACSAIGLIEFNEKEEIITVVEINGILSNKIENEIKLRITKVPTWQKSLDDIISYFKK